MISIRVDKLRGSLYLSLFISPPHPSCIASEITLTTDHGGKI
jgi:hypothetical protein